jgi:hypothetical protein
MFSSNRAARPRVSSIDRMTPNHCLYSCRLSLVVHKAAALMCVARHGRMSSCGLRST